MRKRKLPGLMAKVKITEAKCGGGWWGRRQGNY